MRKPTSAGVAWALLLAGCGAESDGSQSAGTQASPEQPVSLQRETEETSAAQDLEERSVGPVTVRYDPERLAAVDTSIELPPDWDRQANGVKLIAADRASLMGQEECEYGLSGMQLECTPGSEGGIAFAVLEGSYGELRERMAGEAAETVTLANREGTRWSIGVEGERTQFTLLPAGGRTVLIEHRTRNRGNPDPLAIDQVKESLRIES